MGILYGVPHRSCRLCQGPLSTLLDLGTLALAAFPTPTDPPVATAPLVLMSCDACGLVQLQHTVDPDRLYRQYWYRSSINEAMRAELTTIVQAALRTVSCHAGDLVLDVGANDGYLLSQYLLQRAHWHTTRIAVEPAANLQSACQQHAEILVPEYFPPPDLSVLDDWVGRVKVLTSIAMIYDLEDPQRFVQAVDRLLHRDGVWIVQFQDLAQMVDATAFDNICHEHLTYWSLSTFSRLLQAAGGDLQIVHAERRPINGGSLRLLIQRHVHPVAASVDHLLLLERLSVGWQALERFAWHVQAAAQQIGGVLQKAESLGRVIDLYGASTKANTLLQYCQLGGGLIRQAWERNAEKYGRLTATGIPIVAEEEGREDPPDLLLAGIWQFRDGILDRETEFLAGGGQILFPLPEVDLVGSFATGGTGHHDAD